MMLVLSVGSHRVCVINTLTATLAYTIAATVRLGDVDMIGTIVVVMIQRSFPNHVLVYTVSNIGCRTWMRVRMKVTVVLLLPEY